MTELQTEQPLPVPVTYAPEDILLERGTGFAVYFALVISIIRMLGLPEVFKSIRDSQRASQRLYNDLHAMLPAALKALKDTSIDARRIRRFIEKHGDDEDRDYEK